MPRILFGVTVPMTANAFLKPQISVLLNQGWDVHLVCSPDSGFLKLKEIQGITLHSIPMNRNPSPAKDLISLYRWNKLIRAIRPDIIIGSTPKAALLAMLAGKWNKIPARVYQARGFRAEGLNGLKRRIALAAERRTIRSATVVLCDSISLRNALVDADCLPADMGVVLGAGSCCGVDADHFRIPTPKERAKARERLGIIDSEFVVGFVGRVTEDKGVKELIQAVSHIHEQNKRVKLLLAGPDESNSSLLSDQALGSAVQYLGAISDVRSFYWALDAFALPSYREGFGNVNLEAQSCGLPLITTNVTGCIDSQAPSNFPLQVPARDSKAIVSALYLLLADSRERVKMGADAREWVLQNFRNSKVVKQQVEFFTEQVVE